MSMKFLIVSDTHGRMYNLEEAMEREEFDGMIHCGDVEGMDAIWSWEIMTGFQTSRRRFR